MKAAIRYFTKSKKGNTLKLSQAVERGTGLIAETVEVDLPEKTEILFLVNAMYAFTVDKAIKEFLVRNKDRIGEVININSSASGQSTLKAIKKASNGLGFSVSEKEFHCVGSWINMNKGKPSEEDLENLSRFCESILAN